MAIIQKIRTKIIAILNSACVAFIAFIFGISFLMALAVLTPIALLGYSVIMLGIHLTNYVSNSIQEQQSTIFYKSWVIYKKLATGINILKYSPIERKRFIDNY